MVYKHINFISILALVLFVCCQNQETVFAQSGFSNHISFNLKGYVNGLQKYLFEDNGDQLKVSGNVEITNGTNNPITVEITIKIDGQFHSSWGPVSLPANSSMNPTFNVVKTATDDQHRIDFFVEVRNAAGNLIGDGIDSHLFNRDVAVGGEEEGGFGL